MFNLVPKSSLLILLGLSGIVWASSTTTANPPQKIEEVTNPPRLAMWWEKTARPYLKPEAGIFMTPQSNVFIPQAVWTHILEINLPCLSEIIRDDVAGSWTTTVNEISGLVKAMATNQLIQNERLLFEQFLYMTSNQQNVINLLTNIKAHIQRINDNEQYIYGYMDRVCPELDVEHFKDDPAIIDEETKWHKAFMQSYKDHEVEAPLELVTTTSTTSKPNTNSSGRTPLQNFQKRVFKQIQNHGKQNGTSTANATVISNNGTKDHDDTKMEDSIADIEKPPQIEEGEGETLSRRKRDFPKVETFAKNVINQFVNYGNFSNNASPSSQDPIKNWGTIDTSNRNEDRTGSYQPHIGTPGNQAGYSSQFITIQEGRLASTQVPTVTNFHDGSHITTTPEPKIEPQEVINRGYDHLSPKTQFIAILKDILNNMDNRQPPPTFEEVVKDINIYYSEAWKDIAQISSPTPLHVDGVQLGVMTIKVCYNYRNLQNQIKSNCEDRYLPTDKKWKSSCSGVRALQTDAFINQIGSDGTHRSTGTDLISYLANYRIKSVTDIRSHTGDSNSKPLGRRRRGIGDWVMDYAWKPMFGSASEGDVVKIMKFMNASRSATAGIISKQKEMLSLQRDTVDRVNNLTNSFVNVTASLMYTLNKTQSDITKITSTVGAMGKKVDLLAILSTIGTMHQYVNQALTMLKLKLEETSTKYRTIYNMIRRKYISPSVLSKDTVGDLANDFKLFSSDQWMIAPSWSHLATIDDRSAGMYVHYRSLIITLKIPLISITSDYSTYFAQSVPFLTGNHVVEAVGAGSYYIIDKTNRQWVQLTSQEYLTCNQNPGNICPHTYPIHTFKDENCFVNIILGSDLSLPNKLCKVHMLSESHGFTYPESKFISKVVSTNQWVVSILNNTGVQTYERCEESNPNTAGLTSLKQLKGVAVLQVTEGCVIQVGETLFQPSVSWRTQEHRAIAFSDDMKINSDGFKNITIWQMKSAISSAMKNATIFSFEIDEDIKKSNYVFKKGVTSLREFLDAAQVGALDYKHIGLIEPVLPVVPRFNYQEPKSWSLSQWQIWSFLFGSVPVILGGLFLANLVLKRVFTRNYASGAVAFSALPTSFTKAQIMKNDLINITDVVNQVLTARNKLLSSSNSSTLVLSDNIGLDNHLSYWNSLIMCSMLVVMGFMLCIGLHHCYKQARAQKLIRQLLRSVRAFPQNKAITMHNVEEPLVLVFLVEIQRWFSSAVTSTTLAVQVATLPSPADQWSIKDRTYVRLMSSETILHRRSARLITTFNWTHMCIISRLHPNLDTCQEMPQTCVLSRDGVELGIDGGLPWNWRSIKQKRVLKVEIGHIGKARLLYEYNEDINNDYHDIPLTSSLLG